MIVLCFYVSKLTSELRLRTMLNLSDCHPINFACIQVKFLMLLVISVHGQNVGSRSLNSSLETRFACPLENVSLTCSTNGTLLIWEVWESSTMRVQGVLCRLNRSIGNSFSEQMHFDCYGEMLFSGVLDYIGPEVNNVSVCSSSMIIQPLSRNASPDCSPLTIVCKQGPETIKNVTYQVAGESNHRLKRVSTFINRTI